MITLIIILALLIIAAIFITINFVPICIIFFSICGMLLIMSPPKHGRR